MDCGQRLEVGVEIKKSPYGCFLAAGGALECRRLESSFCWYLNPRSTIHIEILGTWHASKPNDPEDPDIQLPMQVRKNLQ